MVKETFDHERPLGSWKTLPLGAVLGARRGACQDARSVRADTEGSYVGKLSAGRPELTRIPECQAFVRFSDLRAPGVEKHFETVWLLTGRAEGQTATKTEG